MAKSPAEQYREITNTLSTLIERVDGIRTDLRDLQGTRDKFADGLNGLGKQIVRVQEAVQQLRKEWDDWDRKRWVFVGLFVGAVLSFLANLSLAFIRK